MIHQLPTCLPSIKTNEDERTDHERHRVSTINSLPDVGEVSETAHSSKDRCMLCLSPNHTPKWKWQTDCYRPTHTHQRRRMGNWAGAARHPHSPVSSDAVSNYRVRRLGGSGAGAGSRRTTAGGHRTRTAARCGRLWPRPRRWWWRL